MNSRVPRWPLMLLLSITLVGCEPPAPVATAPTGPPAPPGAPPPPPTAGSAQPREQTTERVKAEAGVGKQGRSLDQYEGVVVTPVKALFTAKETITFVAQFQHQYDLYKAMDNPVPKDFDDLKAKVLDAYQIKLPPLPQNHKYVWDAEKEELQVERPKR